MHYEDNHEENLLEGVTLTNSISCPNPDLSGLFTIDAYEGHSLTAELEDEFKLSSNEDERDLLNDLSQENSYLDIHLLTQAKKINSHKVAGNTGKSSLKKQKKRNHGERECEKIVGMDTKLVQMLYSGLLDETGAISKISQLILTQQYCKLKCYEKKLVQSLKEIDFTLVEYERQKKSMINQINLLKADNQALRTTIHELHQIIKELQLSIEQYFTSSNHKLPLNYSISRSNIAENKGLTSQKADQQTFQHKYIHQSSEVSKGHQFLQRQTKATAQCISLQDFAQFVHEIKCRSSTLLKGSQEFTDYKLYIPIVDRFSKQSVIRDQIVEIITNLHELQKKNNTSCFTFAGSVLKSSDQQTVMVRFLKILSNKRQLFLQKIEATQDKQLQFWFIVHSTLITFIGIYFHDKDSSLSLLYEDSAVQSRKQIISEITALKELSCICLSEQKERYFQKLLSLVRVLKIRQ